ncbi:helix-turn-helix domain-containing protein [Nocardiopsis sp. EMB25]|uniref:helix-turn-helix domain-containing protein n=1 Tax=Nocardiopsis sp. EMB25 TaxID=2835867 RepID=UPI0022839F71|nr:helix-turn-helix transcriptional regulator [Nocardiopsis sp. EMB25]MCY9786388.1 helix-turn-helix domain-containing protein [Nocardiopsis sp. EMB25]
MSGSPTVRRRRLSYLLRDLRESKGYTAQFVTDQLDWSRGKLTHIEQNQWKRPNRRDIEDLLDIYEVTDEGKRDAALSLVKQARQRGWWVSYSDVWGSGTFVGLEAEASSIRTFEALAIPGLLQTEEYARAVVRSGGITDDDEVDRRVQARMMRKQVLSAPKAPLYWAVIDEAALRKCSSEQLSHLLEVQSPRLGIQILPDSVGPHAALTAPFVILDFPEPDPGVVYVDTGSDELYLEKPPHLARYETLWRHIQATALSTDDSRQLISALRQAKK